MELMPCGLPVRTVERNVKWVAIDGREFDYGEYCNHGYGDVHRTFIREDGVHGAGVKEFKDLPKDGYPYRLKSEMKYLFSTCNTCDCQDKPKIK